MKKVTLDELKALEDKIIDLKKKYDELKFQSKTLKRDLQKIETDIAYDILINGNIDEGIKLSNQQMRDVYIQKKIQDNQQVKMFVAEIDRIESQLIDLSYEISKLDSEYAYKTEIYNMQFMNDEEE